MTSANVLLLVENVEASYNKKTILQGASVRVSSGEIVGLIGPNGSGKSTMLKVISGLLQQKSGNVMFEGDDISRRTPDERFRRGIAHLMQGGEIFPSLAIRENFEVAGHSLNNDHFTQRLDWIFSMFPKLSELQFRRAGLLSGGERQMLALGMILLMKPKLLLLDEPSAGGLAPTLVDELFRTLKSINTEEKVTILLVEQNIRKAVDICDRIYLLKEGMSYRCFCSQNS